MRCEADLAEGVRVRVERDMELERIIYFSDAVFAIAITLLAINLHTPDPEIASNAGFLRALGDDWRSLLAFVISFWVIGMFWLAHHRIYALIVRWDSGLLFRNLLVLLLVALIPWPTRMLAEGGDLSSVTIVYALFVSATGFALFELSRHATKAKLVPAGLDEALLRQGRIRGLVPPVIFAASIPLALVNPDAAKYSWFAIPVVNEVFRLRAHRAGITRVVSSEQVDRAIRGTDADPNASAGNDEG